MTEEVFNTALGNAMKCLMPEWRDHILIEKTKVLEESSGKHPDILVVHDSIPPVAIETSVKKGDADMDAKARLGMHYRGNCREIQTAIAVELSNHDVNTSRLNARRILRYALHQPGYRFPKSGFMRGNVHNLIRLIATMAVSKENMEKTATLVAHKITAAANILEPAIKRQDLLDISRTLYQRSALSGLRTTMILWLNTLLVQHRLYGGAYDIPRITSIPSECVNAWCIIYDINWRAIFKPAINILEHVRVIAPTEVSEALDLLIDAVEHIELARLGSDINIGAELFPKIADDRKESAAFYTQPATAELLAALTITPDMEDWSDDTLFTRFKIADVTSGTGTLLRFGYRQVKAYHYSVKYSSKSLYKLHRDAMEHGLIGTDASPIAAHLTSTGLAVDTKQPYGDTNIGWVGVGNENRTGSIEYIATNAVQDLMMDTIGHSMGHDNEDGYNSVRIDNQSVNIILMNPPYSRTRGGQSAFDISGLSDKERIACQKRWGKLIKDEPCIKTAGMAATFLCVAKKKVKPGGRIGFVLPRTAAFADTWERTRAMVERDFEDITAVAISAGKALGREALSADTMMEEMLLIATRKKMDDKQQSPIKCVTLHEPVTRLGEAAVIAKKILDVDSGAVVVGEEIGVSQQFETNEGAPWSYVGTIHDTLAIIANDLSAGRLRNVAGEHVLDIPMTTLGNLFDVGPTHHLIVNGGSTKGAFKIAKVRDEADALGIHRLLYRADARTQRSLVISPTHKGVPVTKDAKRIWNTRSTLFYSRGMRWNTQAIAAATTIQPVVGGSAWTSLYHSNDHILKAFALWANSIYGMMIYWSRGQRTHSGRSRLQVRAISKVPCPKFDKFPTDTLDMAATEFDRLAKLELLPAYMSTEDKNRTRVNNAVSTMLNIPGYNTNALDKMWCAEPSIRGAK